MEVIQESRIVRWLRRLYKWFLICLSIGLIVASVLILSVLYLRSQPLPPAQIEETTMIYAEDGQVIDQVFHGQNRTYVPLEDIPEHLIQAFIAIEDQHFYEHFGFDFRRIGGAMIRNIEALSIVEGGSTITQQLARNLYLDHDQSVERKLYEAMYTVQLEMHYDKDAILEQYLNHIYFGHSAYGVQAAANMFFDKNVEELTLAESALLAGVPKGPRYFSPWMDIEQSLARQQLILEQMFIQGHIDQRDYEEAVSEEVQIVSEQEGVDTAHQAPYFRDFVRTVAIEEYGIEETTFDQGGLNIYTTLDADMQKKAEEIVDKHLPDDRDLQGALMAMEAETGYIKAMIGGRDYETSPFNRVFAERHSGSSFKPFLYYQALEEGFTPLTLLKSEPMTFTYDDGREEYTPTNFNDSYANDYITLENAIAKSDNIYAVQTLEYLGKEQFVESLDLFQFHREFQPLPSLALGAQNVTLYEMVQAYAILANEGVYNEPAAILKIEDSQGEVIAQAEQFEGEQVLDEQNTFLLNRMLRSVFEPEGTGYRVRDMLNRPVSGKTGSTESDAWMLGYTPQLVSGVWIGYDQGEHINHNNDGRLASYIWADFMEESLADEPPSLYDIPDGVTGAYINPDNGKLATEHCPEKRLLYFKEGTEPTEYCTDHIPEQDGETEANEEQDEVEGFNPPTNMWEKLKEWMGES